MRGRSAPPAVDMRQADTSGVAVVTGANKGIGLAVVAGLCRRYPGLVYLTARDERRGRAAQLELGKLGPAPAFHQLDVTDRESVLRFRDHLERKHGRIDILINNAAVVDSLLTSSYERDKTVIDTNYRSVLTMQELIYPLVRDGGRILNVSSDCGHLSNVRNRHWLDRLTREDLSVEDLNEFVDWFLESSRAGVIDKDDFADNGTIAAYRVSKVALSALTALQQRELEPRNVAVNSLYPGLVRTDMSMHVGFLSADEAAETPIYLVLDAPQTLKGQYVWYDRRIVDWSDHENEVYFKTSMARSWILHSIFTNTKNYIMSFFTR